MKKILLIVPVLIIGFVFSGHSQTLTGRSPSVKTKNFTTVKCDRDSSHAEKAKDPSKDTVNVSIFASGDVRGLISNDSQEQTSTTGSIGIRVEKENVVWSASINIASTIDTLKSDFSKIVLNPASGNRFTSGLLDVRKSNCFKLFDKHIGYHGYISGSSSNWKLKETTKSATVFGFGALLYYDVVPPTQSSSNVLNFGFEGGLTYRGVYGNILTNDLFLEEVFGSKGNQYWGAEMGIYIQFNNITAAIQGYLLYDIEGQQKVEGITSFQITGGISISGSIFNDKIEI